MRQAENRQGRRRGLAVSWLAAALILSGPAQAQNPLPPIAGVESIESQADRLQIETVISRGGWYLIGSAPEGYRIGDGVVPGMAGQSAAYLQVCGERAAFGFGALERTIPAEDYIGKRVRLSARVKNDSPDRVDLYLTALSRRGVILYGKADRYIPGGDWRAREIVMDVPADAVAIEVGLLLNGSSFRSKVWLDSMAIEVAAAGVPEAGRNMASTYQRPMNQPIRDCDAKRYD